MATTRPVRGVATLAANVGRDSSEWAEAQEEARMRSPRKPVVLSLWPVGAAALALALAACAPAAPPSPTTAPAKPTEAAKPAATAALAKPTEAPATKPAEAKPAASPAAKPAEAKPAASPAAKPAEAKPALSKAEGPAASPAAKATFDEKAVADFYRGKTIRIITGSAPGGTYDTYSRMISRHMPKYLPGSPTIIVEAKAGAGGALAANALYNTESKDGTTIGTFGETLVLRQLLGAPGTEYDSSRFNWIGSAVDTAIACAARTDSAVASAQDLLAGKPLVLGTLAPGSTIYDTPATIKAALGLENLKLVSGYDGVAKIILATDSKEVDGYCASFLSMSSTAPQLFQGDKPTARIILIMGDKVPDHPFLKGAVAVESLAKTDEAKQLLQTIHAPSQVTNPYAVAPEVPRDRVEALRKAFTNTFNDPQFQAEAKQQNITFTPRAGAQVQEIVLNMMKLPKATLDKLKAILLT
jgi:tripartite-type tricarboxylate transporter receptor subunit TctC